MPLHGYPGSTGSNAHFFMVITNRTTGSKSIAHPETTGYRNFVGNIGECRRAFVSRNHQVGIIIIVTNHILRRYNLPFDQIIGYVQQGTDKRLIAGNPFCHKRIAAAVFRQALGDKTAFGTHRYDDRIFNLLGFYQSQHLGAEIITAIRPAQTTTGHPATPQMHTFDTR